ncbi:dynamin family protein [Nitrosomonas sp. Nm166]|uniref:dynamin family protein n=1 Tax=Nitrosomonas sp. Nm166 TaxID=1881054 RepID=UPI0008E854E0|nr:dynamin family protein [Nitrosomonas sp. Nm166]SFF23202.1 Dynamin family protein [Nitrosomonas sp. Nm166]
MTKFKNDALKSAKSDLLLLQDTLKNLISIRGDHNDSIQLDIERIVTRTLGIVGEEGAGKSTLVNAIFGKLLVPTDDSKPGTVAPIIIISDSSVTQKYTVRRYDNKAGIDCSDINEFSTYLLQRENPDNHKGVSEGIIRINSHHLADGLKIIDMPGLEGVSEIIRHDAKAALKKIDGAIVVINDRHAAPGLRTVAELAKLGREIDAIIINIRSSKLLNDDTCEPLDNTIIENNINEIREFVWNELHCNNVNISIQNIFVIHLPSIKSLAILQKSPMATSLHKDEVERFADWFNHNYGHEGEKLRILRASELISNKLDMLTCTVRNEAFVFAEMRNGNHMATQYAMQILAERENELYRRWQIAFNKVDLNSAIKKAQLEIVKASERLKICLKELRERCASSLSHDRLTWNAYDRDRIARELNAGIAAAAAELASIQINLLNQYKVTCSLAAQFVIEFEDDILTPIKVQLPADDLTFSKLWQGPYLYPVKNSFFDFEWIWSANSIDRLLEEIRDCEALIDTSIEGSISRIFNQQLEEISKKQIERLKKRLSLISSIITKSGSSYTLLRVNNDYKKQIHLISVAQKAFINCKKTLDNLEEAEFFH